MPATKFTEATRARIVASLHAGLTAQRAADAGGVSYATLKEWLRRGRRTPEGEFGAFLAAVDEARGEADARIMSEDDVLRELSRRGRDGSIAALRELLAHYRRERERDASPGDGPEADDAWAGAFSDEQG